MGAENDLWMLSSATPPPPTHSVTNPADAVQMALDGRDKGDPIAVMSGSVRKRQSWCLTHRYGRDTRSVSLQVMRGWGEEGRLRQNFAKQSWGQKKKKKKLLCD